MAAQALTVGSHPAAGDLLNGSSVWLATALLLPCRQQLQFNMAGCHPPALPCRSFTTYVMLQALLAKPLSLLRLWGLVLFWLRSR